MGQNQSENIIDDLNKAQNIYYIKSKKSHLSKYPCFKGYPRSTSDSAAHTKDKKISYDDKSCFFLKLLPYSTTIEKKCIDREQELLQIFDEDKEILKNEKLVNVNLDDKECVLVPSKYYTLKDVFEYLWHEVHYTDEKLICVISFQALKILKILKDHNVVHNGIKFENFIVESENPVKIILTDFKHAQKINEEEKSKMFGGTSIFKAPEVLEKKGHDFSAEMWSLGCNIYLSLFNKYPFDIEQDDDDNTILYKIKNNELTNKNKLASKDAWDVITKMFVLRPESRITPEEAIELDWFEEQRTPPNVAPADGGRINMDGDGELNV